ncbi:MAG: host attachment protein [Candidatus Sulfotelmatobacter sp.]
MITREQVHELAQFEDRGGCAVSFYFQPTAPRNKAHKEEAIVTKDLLREATRQLESKSKCESARADLDRIARLSRDLRGNGTHAKAVFACAVQGFWREYDLPPQLNATQLLLDRRFHLKPLVQLLGAFPSLGVVLADRHRARLFDLRLGELTEREGFFHPLSRRGRSDGFAGYDGGHAERRVADEARQHFKLVAEVLKNALEKRSFEKWILGCQEAHWTQFQPQLHPDVAQRLLGRFSAEVAHVSREEIRSQGELIFAEWRKQHCSELVRETVSQSRSNGRGVTGLRRVLRSLELGEVQTLLIGENYTAQAVECTGCGHLDAHLVSFCPACGRETREVVDVAQAILPRVLRHDIELYYVKDDAGLDSVGNVAALLRFRSDQNKVREITVAGKESPRRQPGLVGRYRGVAAS